MKYERNIRWSIVLGLALIFLSIGCARTPEEQDRRTAEKMADQVLDAMGGERALNDIRFLNFDFVVEDAGQEILRRSHLWDRATGDYRMEWRDGQWPVIIFFNVNTRQGRALKRLRPVPAGEAADLIEKAYAAFINDTYWLMSATKLRDPGTQLTYNGENLVQQRLCPTLALWFDKGIGLTPRDRYWFYIDNRTGLPFGWAFVLKGEATEPKIFLWKEWRQIGDLKLPTRFEPVEGDRVISIKNLYVPATISERVFREP